MRTAKSTLSDSQKVSRLGSDDPLVEVGFSSLDLANLMIALEAEFDVFIPSSHLTPDNFRSIRSITAMMDSILPTDGRTV